MITDKVSGDFRGEDFAQEWSRIGALVTAWCCGGDILAAYGSD